MDFEILQGFIKQAQAALPHVRASLAAGAQTNNRYGELQAARHQVNSIRNAASIVGLEEIVAVCDEFEANLRTIIDANLIFDRKQAEVLLGKCSILEDLIADINSSADVLHEPAGESTISNHSPEEFEIDEDLLEIFALEARELTEIIRVNLKILENSQNNPAALLEIRRAAHTLKGSAAIVGLESSAQLAHSVEDLLDYLPESASEKSEKYFQLLFSAVDCFEQLSNGEHSAQLSGKIARFYLEYDRVVALLPVKRAPIFVDAEQTKEKAIPEPVGDRSLIRISLEKLDDLMTAASVLTNANRQFKRRLDEMGRQIAELYGESLHSIENGFGKQDLPEPDDKAESARTTIETAADSRGIAAVAAELRSIKDNLARLSDRQGASVEALRGKLHGLRMVRFGSIAARLHRTVAAACEAEEKNADLIIEGESFEIDTQTLDSLVEPLTHLLRNAVSHGVEAPELRGLLGKPERGEIKLTVAGDDTDVRVIVGDDGRGISADALIEKAVEGNFISRAEAEEMSRAAILELIFLPGLTTAAERLSRISGRGIGMNVVKTRIERYGGSISIDSEASKGTTFSLRLPASRAHERTAARERTAKIKTVLIVDDSPSARRAISESVENAGWTPLVARDAIEALKILNDCSEPFALIVTDAEMPRMNGCEFLAALKQSERCRRIPVVMITSRTDDRHRRKAFDCGVDEYLTKPFEDSVLLDKIGHLTNQN